MRNLNKTVTYLLAALPFYFFCHNTLAQDFQKWETTIAKFEKTDESQPIRPGKNILFTGSSSIVGWTCLAKDFPNKKILNRGFGGSQTFEVLHFADRIIAPYRPK